MRVAFKEWAVVVDALGRGAQTVVLRKGGIHEAAGGFQVEHPAFLLFSTRFHQQRESVRPVAQGWFDELAPHLPPPEVVRLELFAEVVAWQKLDSLAAVQRLHGQHIWRDEVVARRFEWGEEENIFALVVRVFRLAHPVEMPLRPDYGGCKSWVELECDVPTAGATPVLGDALFAEKLKAFHAALEPAGAA